MAGFWDRFLSGLRHVLKAPAVPPRRSPWVFQHISVVGRGHRAKEKRADRDWSRPDTTLVCNTLSAAIA